MGPWRRRLVRLHAGAQGRSEIMALNPTIRGRFGTTITEATMVPERNVVFHYRVNRFEWNHVDDDEPAESMMAIWDEPGNPNKLNKGLLWELVGPANTPVGTDDELRTHLLRQLTNREKIWNLMKEAVTAVNSGQTAPFMNEPLSAANKAGCLDIKGGPIDLYELMRMMHMFGKRDVPEAPRPIDPIVKPDDYYYSTEQQVAVEVRRRVRELAAGINWEGNVTGGREKKKVVWNRHGLYCGCG
jgi:hypothetical protein